MKKPITHSLPDSPLLGWFKMSNQQCLTNASLAGGIRKGGWPLLCASPRRNLPGEREGNGGDGRGWRRERGGVGAVTHASLMGWTDWTCVIQMPRTNINTLTAKPFRKGALRSFLVKAIQYHNGDGKCRRLSGEPLLRLNNMHDW